MKKRNLLAVFALSVVTFGIYDIYWLVQTKKELNAKTRVHVPTIWLLFAPLILVVIAFIVMFAGIASDAHTMSQNAHVVYNADGTTTTVTTGSATAAGFGAAGILLSLFAFIVAVPCTFYWFFKYSKAVNEYTNGSMSTALTFLLLWLLHYIGVLFVQDAYNDMIDNGTVPGQGMAPVGNMPMGQPAYAGPQPVAGAPMGQPQPMQPVAPTQPQMMAAPAPMQQPQPGVISPSQPQMMAAPAPAPVVAPTMQTQPPQNPTPPGPTLVQ